MFFFYCSLRPNPPVLLSSPACRHGCGGMSRPQHFSVLAPLCYCNTRVTNTDCLMNRPVLTWMAVSIHSLHTTKLNRGIMLNSTAKKWSHWKFGTTHCTQKTKVVTLKIWLSVCTAGHTCIFLRVRVCVCMRVCVCTRMLGCMQLFATLWTVAHETPLSTTKALLGLKEWSAAAKSLQSCPTPCDPIDGSPRGSPVPGILQARTLEWVAISFSNAWKWKVKGKSLSHIQLFATPWTAAYQAPPSMGLPRQEYWSGLPLPSPKNDLGPVKPLTLPKSLTHLYNQKCFSV